MNVILGDLNYQIGIGRDNSLLYIAGNWCGNNAIKLGVNFVKVIQHVHGKLFLDLEGCKSMDSIALNWLIQLQKILGDKCLGMVLVNVPTPMLEILKGSHIHSLYEILPTLGEAEKKYGSFLT